MKTKALVIDEHDLTLGQLALFLDEQPKVSISETVKKQILKGREVVQNIVATGKVVYGVNTGFGKFADISIEPNKTKELQRNLVLSHAAGIGEPFGEKIVRLMMLLKIKNLSQGYSGVRLEVVEQLVGMINNDIIPIIPAKGSVGASGDLAPLAHMALTMIGEGDCTLIENKILTKLSSKEALKKVGLKPLHLVEKEGLAILNGTQAIQANGILALLKMKNLVKAADIIGAISLESLHGTLTAFDERIHKIRRHPGQTLVAENIRNILKESQIVDSHKQSHHKVQDAYCLRCIPQVHGAIRDGLQYVESVYKREINGVTDNPLVFPDNGDVLSGGNFHGEPVALAADYLGIIAAELANISERRIEHMMDSSLSELAGFLTTDGGLNSGFMIAHVTAASLVSENKVLAHPASVDSIPTSANKEDHVSMGTHAARKALEIIENSEYVLAVELICGCQALDLRQPVKPSPITGRVLKKVREEIDYWKEDRQMNIDIEAAFDLINKKEIVTVVEGEIGNLK